MLARVIESLLNQTYQGFEIIVVDDGSVDGTENMIERLMKRTPCELAYFKQENKGAASARNVGIKHAKEELILFIDDDVLPAPNLLQEHIDWHQRHHGENIAILGSVVWAPELKVTPFMRWLTEKGIFPPQSREKNGAKLDHGYFITANISLKRRFMLEKGIFDESFKPSFEDIELGYRLEQQNLQIIFNKNAIGYHLRGATFQGYCDWVKLAGQSAAMFYTKWPAAILSLPRSTPNIKTVFKEIGKKVIQPSVIPIFKYIIGWLDNHDYTAPSFFYAKIYWYYFHIGYKKGLKASEK
ncbi:hypothetical protein ES703_113577 [subsurface metagenome]